MAEHAACFIFLLTLLEVVVKTKMTIHGNSHGKEKNIVCFSYCHFQIFSENTQSFRIVQFLF
jgi:hypothetical protein